MDPNSRTVGQFVAEEVAAPLGLKHMHIGMSRKVRCRPPPSTTVFDGMIRFHLCISPGLEDLQDLDLLFVVFCFASLSFSL